MKNVFELSELGQILTHDKNTSYRNPNNEQSTGNSRGHAWKDCWSITPPPSPPSVLKDDKMVNIMKD